jgi:nucleosome binding factor SPN SPT16 subunit
MADDQIVIDKALFNERLNNLVTKWKADKRSGDQVFQGASSIATLVGKQSEQGIYHKSAAFQVRLLIFRFGSLHADHTAVMAARL